MRKLPPLSTLPVLEAAARLSSFSAAAEELHVTHGAISHQIRSLEEYLGVPVFARIGDGVLSGDWRSIINHFLKGSWGRGYIHHRLQIGM